MIHDKNNYCRKADQELVFLTTSDPSNNYHGPQPRDRNPKNQPPSAGNKKLRGNHVQEGQKSTAPPKINTSSRRVITHSIVSFQDSALPSFYPLMKESTGIKGYFDFIIGCTTHGTGWMACQDRKTIMSNRIIGLGDPFDSLAPPPPYSMTPWYRATSSFRFMDYRWQNDLDSIHSTAFHLPLMIFHREPRNYCCLSDSGGSFSSAVVFNPFIPTCDAECCRLIGEFKGCAVKCVLLELYSIDIDVFGLLCVV